MIKHQTLTKRRLLSFLTQLESQFGDYLTIYLTPSPLSQQMTDLDLTEEIKNLLTAEEILKEAQHRQTGAAIFWSQSENTYLVLPPFPIPENRIFRGKPQTSVLRQLLAKERALGVILVTWGWYAIGVFKGAELVSSKVGTGHIHPKHRKGGRSQKRFARRTEEQKKDFLRRVSGRIEERLKPNNLEQIFFGGNRLILKPLLEECHSLDLKQISPRLLAARHANKEALLGSLEEINKSVVFEV